MSNVVEFRDVTKSYRLGAERANFRAALPGRLGRRAVGLDLVALRDLSLTLSSGESLGIIGRNGAGKSTLLKLAAGVTAPTRGAVSVRGRTASLIELGVGFHPDLSGTENVYFSAAILGLGRREVKRRYDDIVQFAGIESFLTTPVKRYSSGMLARLGFAVATHVDAEVLVVDEVLAVGDVEFQAKSYDRIRALRSDGAAILFVTHNLWVLPQVCDAAVRLDHGAVADSGPSQDVVQRYLFEASGAHPAQPVETTSGRVTIHVIEFDGTTAHGDDQFVLRVDLDVNEPLTSAVAQVAIGRVDGLVLAGDDIALATGCLATPGRHTLTGHLGPIGLHAGVYRLWLNVIESSGTPLVHAQAVIDFDVEGDTRTPHTYGYVRLPATWRLK